MLRTQPEQDKAPDAGGSHASVGCGTVAVTMSGCDKRPEENTYEEGTPLLRVSGVLSKQLAFELTRRSLPFKDQGVFGLWEGMFEEHGVD